MHFHNSFVFLIFVGRMFLRIKDDVESVLQYQLDFYLEFPCVMYEFDFFICGICMDFPNFSSLFGVFRNWWVFHNHLVKRNLRTSEVLLSSLLFPSQHYHYGVHLPLCWKFPLCNFEVHISIKFEICNLKSSRSSSGKSSSRSRRSSFISINIDYSWFT